MSSFDVPRPEDGSSEASLENAEHLVKQHGLPDKVRLLVRGPSDREYVVEGWWNKRKHEFRGFSWGYKGAEPRALEKLFALIRLPIAMNVIAKFRPEDMRYDPEWNLTYPFEFRKGVHYT